MPWQQTATAALSLAGVVLLILALSRAGRRFARRAGIEAGPARLAIRASLALDSRRRLHLIDVEGRQALVVTGGGGDMLISWPQTPAGPAA